MEAAIVIHTKYQHWFENIVTDLIGIIFSISFLPNNLLLPSYLSFSWLEVQRSVHNYYTAYDVWNVTGFLAYKIYIFGDW